MLQNTLGLLSEFLSKVAIRRSAKITGQLDAVLDYTEYLFRTSLNKHDEQKFHPIKRKKQLHQQHILALKSLSLQELYDYYSLFVDLIPRLISEIPYKPIAGFLQSQVYSRSYNLRIWKLKMVKLDYSTQTLFAEKQGKVKVYDLGDYLIRKSNTKDYYCLVLEAINDHPHAKSRTVHLGFQLEQTADSWQIALKRSIQQRAWNLLKTSVIVDRKEERANSVQDKADSYSWKEKRELTHMSHDICHSQVSQWETSETKDMKHLQIKSVVSVMSQPFLIQPPILSRQMKEQMLRQSMISRVITNGFGLQNFNIAFGMQLPSSGYSNYFYQIDFWSLLISASRLRQLQELITCSTPILTVNSKHFSGTIQQGTDSSILVRIDFLTHLQKEHWLSLYLGARNSSIAQADLKATIKVENASIHRYLFKPFNKLYRNRQFWFIRHVCQYNSHYCVIDKSFKLETPTNEENVRGFIDNVCLIDSYSLRLSLRMKQGEGLTPQQATSLTLVYAKGLMEAVENSYTSDCNLLPLLEAYDLNQNHFQIILENPEGPLALEQPPQQELPIIKTTHQQTSVASKYLTHFDQNDPKYTQKTTILNPCFWKTQWVLDIQGKGFIIKCPLPNSQKQRFKMEIERHLKENMQGNKAKSAQLYDPEKFIRRLTHSLQYALHVLKQKNSTQMLMECFKFGLLQMLYLGNQKQFATSEIGETYSCRFDGLLAYAEVTTANPLGISVLAYSEHFRIHGQFYPQSMYRMNNRRDKTDSILCFTRIGTQELELCMTMPETELMGLVDGPTRFSLDRKAFYWIPLKNVVLSVQFKRPNAKNPQFDHFVACMSEVSSQFMRDMHLLRRSPTHGEVIKEINTIEGRWTELIDFEGVCCQETAPFQDNFNIPSHSNH